MPARHLDAVPAHLPRRLTITLWDFTWYTQTTPGEPFHDLDRAFAEAVERGYNTVRICAMPFLLFGDHDIDIRRLEISGMGAGVGRRTRWYDVAGGAVLDGREHLRELFEAARRHDCYVILSSWEYQQSPAFLEGSEWYDALMAIPHGRRHTALARAMVDLVQYLKDVDLADRIAYAELHNEVDLSRLSPDGPHGDDPYWAQRALGRGRRRRSMREAHPDVLATTCYGIPPYRDMGSVPDNGQVAHFHVYVYGVLAALEEWAGVRVPPPEFPRPQLQSLLRDDAPASRGTRRMSTRGGSRPPVSRRACSTPTTGSTRPGGTGGSTRTTSLPRGDDAGDRRPARRCWPGGPTSTGSRP